MRLRGLRYTLVMCVALVVVSVPRVSLAQQMNFSYYTDVALSSDLETFYTIVDGFDNSTGCQHFDYLTTGNLYMPSGYVQQTFPGLQAFFAMPFEEGDWSLWSELTVSCSCYGGGLSAGGGGGGGGLSSKRYSAAYELASLPQNRWTKVPQCPHHECQQETYYEYVNQTQYQVAVRENLPLYLSQPGRLVRVDWPGVGWLQYCRWNYTTQDVGWYYCDVPR